jgi:hypothetical protein
MKPSVAKIFINRMMEILALKALPGWNPGFFTEGVFKYEGIFRYSWLPVEPK